MNAEETVKLLTLISSAYPGKFSFPTGDPKKDSGVIQTWRDLLNEYPPKAVEIATRGLIKSGAEWPPSIGQIIARVRQIIEPEFEQPLEAWGSLIKAIERHGVQYTLEPVKAAVSPETWHVANMIGINRIANADPNDTYLMNTFIKHYEGHIKVQRDKVLVGGTSPKLIEP